jgi:hypothetical protein
MGSKKRASYVIEERTVKRLGQNDQDFFLIIHEIHDVGEKFITSSFFAQSN